jgi:N-acetylglutamate synthase-like GNAT family acetyltransferase
MRTRKGKFIISTNKKLLQPKVIHGFLKNSYWAKNIPYSKVEKAIKHSLCFGLYEGKKQIGFARVLTDYARFANIHDVFVLDKYKGQGLGVWLMENILKHPQLGGMKKWYLATRDAHEFYKKFGFKPVAHPERSMEILNINPYPD